MKSYQVLQLPIKRKQEKVHLDPALASRLEPIQFKTGLSASTFTGKLDARDNKYTLKVSSFVSYSDDLPKCLFHDFASKNRY